MSSIYQSLLYISCLLLQCVNTQAHNQIVKDRRLFRSIFFSMLSACLILVAFVFILHFLNHYYFTNFTTSNTTSLSSTSADTHHQIERKEVLNRIFRNETCFKINKKKPVIGTSRSQETAAVVLVPIETISQSEDERGENASDDIESPLPSSRDDEYICCSICLSSYEHDDIVIQSKYCSHYYHKTCILQWLENHFCCPTCRTKMICKDELIQTTKAMMEKKREQL